MPGTSLDIRRAQVQRWAKAPSIVVPRLAQKEQLTWRERLWVYQWLVATAAFAGLFTLSVVWIHAPYTWQGCAIALLCVSTLGTAGCIGVSLMLFVSDKHDPVETAIIGLSYQGRKRLVLYDRNRKRMPWRAERLQRERETDGTYPEFSVWVESRDTWVDFRVFVHDDRGRGPSYIRPYLHNGVIARRNVQRPPLTTENYHEAIEEFMQQVGEEQAALEEMARTAERMAYEEQKAILQTKRTVLIGRR